MSAIPLEKYTPETLKKLQEQKFESLISLKVSNLK